MRVGDSSSKASSPKSESPKSESKTEKPKTVNAPKSEKTEARPELKTKLDKPKTPSQPLFKSDTYEKKLPAKVDLGQSVQQPVSAQASQAAAQALKSTTAEALKAVAAHALSAANAQTLVAADAGTTVKTAALQAQGTGTTLRPDVETALDEIDSVPPSAKANILSTHLEAHGSNSPEDVEFRNQLLKELGPDEVGQMLKDGGGADGIYNTGWSDRTVLSAASSVFTPAEQGKIAETYGAENLSKLMAISADRLGDPALSTDTDAQIRAQLDGVSKFMGNVYDLPAGAPGREAVTGALDRLKSGQEPLLFGMPGEEAATWVVSHSNSDALKQDFVKQYIEDFKKDPSTLTPVEARHVATVLGSMEPPSKALAPLVDGMTHDQRKDFLSKMTEIGPQGALDPNTPGKFRQDAVDGVNAFLMDVARLNPATFGDPAAANDFRAQAFRAATQAMDNTLFQSNQGTKDALAHMFAADPGNLINQLSNTTGPNWDTEGKDLAKFFQLVAFQNEGGTRQTVVDAMQKYLGIGDEQGVADLLAANKGNPAFMAQDGNRMAREMGFLLGALHQGANSALKNIDDEVARKKAVVDIIGSIAEAAIEASPVSKAYDAIKKGTGNQADVTKVFDWLSQTFLQGPADASKDGVTKLSDSVISNAWAPFFGDDSLNGASSEDLVNLYSLINAGVALGDGTPEASIKIGG